MKCNLTIARKTVSHKFYIKEEQRMITYTYILIILIMVFIVIKFFVKPDKFKIKHDKKDWKKNKKAKDRRSENILKL